MLNLDLVLRTPGQLLVLDRRRAEALVEHAFEDRAGIRRGGFLRSLFGAASPRAEADAEERRDVLATPQVRWAGTVEAGDGYAIVDGVAIIDVSGVLTPDGYYDFWADRWTGGYAQIGAAVEAARGDDRVRALFIRADSPGGLVDGCFDLAAAMRAGNAANGGKPVWVHSRMACSAAYALASAADRIVAAAESDIGSIGVLVLHVDMTAMLEEWGLKVDAIQSGARKTDGAPWKPLSDDARTHLQGVVDQVARRFVATVNAGRPILTPEAIRAQEARWFLAEHDDPKQSGLALGLCDAIASERDAFGMLVQSLSDETGTGAPVGTGSNATRANPKQETETMKLADQIAALRKKAAAGDEEAKKELTALGVSLKARAEGDEADDDKDEAAEGEEDDKEAEGEEDEKDAEGEDDDDGEEEPAADASGSKAGFALLDCREAKGRDQLARQLARKVSAGKITYGEAKKMLAAAPKGSRLADAMAGRDVNPGSAETGSEADRGGTKGWARAVAKVNNRFRG